MNNFTLGVYEKSMPDTVPLEQKLVYAREAGFDFLELSVDESDARLTRLDWPAAQRAALRQAALKAGIRIDTMCLSAHRKYPLGSADAQTAARGLTILEQAVELAVDVGIRIIQLAGYDVYYEPSTQDTVGRFAENLERCVELAARGGVTLGFETMETPFMNTVEKAMRYVNKVNSPYLQVYPDVGNLTNGTDDVTGDLRKGAGHLVAAHLKDTKPGVFRDLFYGEGRVDFPNAAKVLAQLGVRKFNAEFWYRAGSDWQKVLCQSHDYLAGVLSEA